MSQLEIQKVFLSYYKSKQLYDLSFEKIQPLRRKFENNFIPDQYLEDEIAQSIIDAKVDLKEKEIELERLKEQFESDKQDLVDLFMLLDFRPVLITGTNTRYMVEVSKNGEGYDIDVSNWGA